MKNIVKFAIVSLISILSFTSCVVRPVPMGQPLVVRPMGQMGQQVASQQGQRGARRLDSVTVTKRQTGYCQARIWQGPANTPTNVQRVSDYAASVYEKTGHVPSEQTLSAKFGFRAQARWIDTPDRVVGKVTVRPDEVPASIRARFQ